MACENRAVSVEGLERRAGGSQVQAPPGLATRVAESSGVKRTKKAKKPGHERRPTLLQAGTPGLRESRPPRQ